MNHYDVIIVGAGFTGLYVAHRLLQDNPNLKIMMYEKGTRVGGRIITETKFGHILEYGPMRFEPDLQPRFAALLQELDIAYKEFPPYTTPFKSPKYDDITFQEIQVIESDKSLPPSFALLKYALKQILDEQWDVYNDDIKEPDRDKRKSWLKRNGRFHGYYLHELGLWDVLAHVLSKPAIDYVMYNGTFYHMIEVNPNAADIICFILDILATCKYHLITIDKGTQVLTDKLLNTIKNNVTLQLDTRVSAFVEQNNEIIVSTQTQPDITLTSCDRLIFACQKTGIINISGFEAPISKLFESVFVIKLYKIFVVLENPPWDEKSVPEPNFAADKLPCREVHYYYNTNNKTGMLMIYGDVPSLHYWRYFFRGNEHVYEPKYNHSERLKDHLNHYLRNMFPRHHHFDILDYGILDWSSPPHETGVHIWRPGFKSSDVMKRLACFGKRNKIHICGETYSDYQGFIEGCIRTSDMVIDMIKKEPHN